MKKIWNILFIFAFIIINYSLAAKFGARVVIDKPIIEPIDIGNIVASILYFIGFIVIGFTAGYYGNRGFLITGIMCLCFSLVGFSLMFVIPLFGIIISSLFLPAVQGISFDNGVIELLLFILLPIAYWRCFILGQILRKKSNEKGKSY